MKKFAVRLLLFLVFLVLVGVIAVHFFLDGAIKKGVETVGPKITKVETRLNSVNLSLLTGSCSVNGFLLGNPEGFKSKSAISVGGTHIALRPSSLLSDKIVIQTVNVQAPEITFETGLNVRENNLSKIIANLDETTGGSGAKSAPQPADKESQGTSKKLQVDEFIISGGKLHVIVTALGGKSVTLSLPEIQLKDLGQGPDGITPAELSKRVLQALEKEAAQLAATALADLSKGAMYMGNDLNKSAATNTDKLKGISDLFKKKK